VTAQTHRVVVVSPVADHLNTNWRLRTYVGEGFAELCGAENVLVVPELLAERTIDERKPDLVVVFGGVMPDGIDLRGLRRAADRAGAHLAAWLHDDPYELDFAYRAVDVADSIFTNDAGSVDYYRHASVHHLPLAASPTAHRRPIGTDFLYDLFFCGRGFEGRVAFFNDMPRDAMAPFRTLVGGTGWPQSRAFYSNLRIPNERLADSYAASMCTVALGRDLDLGNERYMVPQSTPGPRVFEAAMAGCIQLYFVYGLEVAAYFEPEREILLIDSASEVPERLADLTAHPERLLALRAATQARALRDHTYAARARRILDVAFPAR
jgi:spore maturation protein CgeB